jgi:hypothetical protein
MSASFAAWSPVFYEVKRLLPRKLIGGAMRRPGWGVAGVRSLDPRLVHEWSHFDPGVPGVWDAGGQIEGRTID